MTNKEQYMTLCETQSMPFFMQAWWLSGVCAGHTWDVLFCRDVKGEICAAMPYMMNKHWWKRYVVMPNLTPYGGVWVREDMRDNAARLENIAHDLDGQLRGLHVDFYLQRYHCDSPVCAVMNEHFKRVHRSTHVLEQVGDPERVLKGFSANKRKKLEQRTKDYVVDTMSVEDFYRFHVACNAEKGKHLWYTREMLLVQLKKASDRQCCRLICIRNAQGQPLAAAVLVWDDKMVYQLLNCYVHEKKDNGAREMLTFECIRQAGEQQKGLDFLSHRSYLRHYGATRKDFYALRLNHSILVSLHLLTNKLLHWRRKQL